jgi:hypothetical protein
LSDKTPLKLPEDREEEQIAAEELKGQEMLSDNEEEKKHAKPLTANLSPLHTQGTDSSRMQTASKSSGVVSDILKFELSGLQITPHVSEPILEGALDQQTHSSG